LPTPASPEFDCPDVEAPDVLSCATATATAAASIKMDVINKTLFMCNSSEGSCPMGELYA